MRYSRQVPGRLHHVPIAQADMVDPMLAKLNMGEVCLCQHLRAHG